MPAPDPDYRERQGDTTPTPDPTRLTTQLVDRALSAFREVVETRFDGIDRATALNATDVARVSALIESGTTHQREDMDRQLAALREFLTERIDHVADVAGEKFTGVDTRFAERDERVAQAAQESRISLDAALAAAKEAVSEQNKAGTLAIGKSEQAMVKQIDSNASNTATNIKSLEDKLTDVKDRLTRVETATVTRTEVRTDSRLNVNQVILALGFILAAITLVVGLR